MKILDVPQSGSQGGIVSSRNRFGQYRRTRAIPVNPNTSAQATVRSRLSDFSAQWRGLTESQRLGWIGLAASVTLSNSLGQSINLTGHQMFVRCNATLKNAGEASITAAPVEPSFDPQGVVTAAADASAHTIIMAAGAFPTTATDVVVDASPQLSAGRYFNARYALIQVSDPADFDTLDIGAAYEAKFGVLAAGKVIFIRVRQQKDGFTDVGQILRVTIVP